MPSETPTDAPATDYRSLLQIEQANLEAELSELGFDDGKTGLDYDANFADTSQVTAERGEAEALAGKLKDTLEEVHAAIDRLDAGHLRPVRGRRRGHQPGPARGHAGHPVLHQPRQPVLTRDGR